MNHGYDPYCISTQIAILLCFNEERYSYNVYIEVCLSLSLLFLLLSNTVFILIITCCEL